MRPKSFFLALITLLICVVLSSCSLDDPTSANADPPISVTPYDTSAGNMIATVQINEDQDATDQLSNITFGMRFDAIEEDNYVNFTHNEYVDCNHKTKIMYDQPQYTLKIDPGGYFCYYRGYNSWTKSWWPRVEMFTITGRSRLHPQALSFSSQSYTIQYTPDSAGLACPITAEASDNSGNSVNGGTSSSANGFYEGPITNSLTGKGEILLTRTCSWKFMNPPPECSAGLALYEVNLTYRSTASVEVTWSH
jgi:hypothetical protein